MAITFILAMMKIFQQSLQVAVSVPPNATVQHNTTTQQTVQQTTAQHGESTSAASLSFVDVEEGFWSKVVVPQEKPAPRRYFST